MKYVLVESFESGECFWNVITNIFEALRGNPALDLHDNNIVFLKKACPK